MAAKKKAARASSKAPAASSVLSTRNVISQLERGDTLTERRLWQFVHAVERGRDVDADDLSEIAKALRRILQGEKPKKALNLERPQGRKKTVLKLDEIVRVPVLVAEHLRKRGLGPNDHGAAESIRAIAKQIGASEATVWRKYSALKERAHSLARVLEQMTVDAQRCREMRSIFGDDLLRYNPPAAWVEDLARRLEKASVSEQVRIVSEIKSILEKEKLKS